MEFQKQFGKPLIDDLEVNSGELITEQAGYIPPKTQIENMINAGYRLNQSRGLYDWDEDEEIDEEAIDPTRSGNYDMADATQEQFRIERDLKTQYQAQQEALQRAQNNKTGVSTPEISKEPEKG